jgi:Cd2+/Zn2+-exporting ATPase
MEKHEEEDSLKKIIFAAVLFAAAVVIQHLPAFQSDSAFLQQHVALGTVVPMVDLALYLVAYLLVGLDVVKEAVFNLFHGKLFDEEFLMSVASIGAVCLGEYPEAVAVMLLYELGEFLEDKAVGKSKDSISALMNIRPDKAFVMRGGKTIEVKPEDVAIGELLVVKAGERLPLDGIVTKGKSFVDTSALTGESVPREIVEGNEVLAGFVNTTGTIEVKVSKVYGDSAVARVLDLVQNAASKKAKSEQFITRFSRIYTPTVCGAAVLLAVLPPVISQLVAGLPVQDGDFHTWIYRALLFLVVSCPCALVISVPLSFFAGIGAASRKGILIKGANDLEKLSQVQTAVFDKTGTLTKGVFIVTAVHPVNAEKVSAEELVAIATHAEYYSNHPISRSLKAAHHCAKCGSVIVDNTEEISGQGLKTVLDGKQVLAGNMKLMEAEQVQGIIPCKEDDTGTVVHIAVDGQYAGHIVISDELKDDAALAVKQLKKCGVKKTVLLTGDSQSAAEKAGDVLGIDEVYSGLLPGDKVSRVEELLAQETHRGGTVAFVGDGINDAPVLTRADVGIAMGGLGSDAAIEAADVVIMDDMVSKVGIAVRGAKKTMAVVRENIIFALAVKLAIMVLGALGLVNMWLAVFGDVGVTFIAVANAMRLLVPSKK